MGQTTKQLLTLLIIGGLLYAFNPMAGWISSSSEGEVGHQTLSLNIKDRNLIDPRQADLKVKVGDSVVLRVLTDEDGRMVLRSGEREVASPIFSGTTNTLTVPTDQPGEFNVNFEPGAKPGVNPLDILLGVIVVSSI